MPQNSGVTFVTCFVHIYETEPFEHKNIQWRIERFREIANLGVNICVYGCPVTMPFLIDCIKDYPNVRILDIEIGYKESPLYKMCLDENLSMPERRNPAKDTIEYMALMNAKIEFVYDCMKKNPFNSDVFAWMDFSMAYIFNNKDATLERLRALAYTPNFKDKFFAIPGCWDPIPPNNCSAIINSIHWRFCGTFFMGDKHTMLEFHKLYREHYPKFLEENKKLVWEVNIWAYLEANTDWYHQWYASDHNDRIIDIPLDIYTQ